MPIVLAPGVPVTSDGRRRLRFGYNLGKCSDAVPGEKSYRGYHVCTTSTATDRAQRRLEHAAHKILDLDSI